MSTKLVDLGPVGVTVSRETTDRLALFLDRLLKWSDAINLISPTSKADAWRRHIVDSAQLFPHMSEGVECWCDLGSGGGLPAIVNAVIAKEHAPDVKFVLVESDQRKASFLRIVIKELGLNAGVECCRIEDLQSQQANLVSVRALAPLEQLLGYVDAHMRQDGYALLMKGRQYASEITKARQSWAFDLQPIESKADPESRILRVSQIFRLQGARQ